MEIKKDAFISNNEEVYINKSYISCGGYAFNSYAQNALGNIVNSYIPKGKGINASIGSGLWIHNCTIMAGVDLTIFELGFTKMSNNIIKGKTHLTNLQSDTSLYMYYGANNNCFMNDTFVYSYYYGGTTITFTKLNDWKGYFPWLDSFSFIADPKIASIVDPTPRDSIVFGKGETLNYPTLNYAAIKDDYFGNTRNLNNPTIGCVEAIGRIALNLSGTVKDSRHIAMKNTRVYLVYYDPSDTALKFRDSTYTDSFGYYIFNNVSDTLVHAMAVPDSTKFPMEMPTYADSSAVYNLSRTVHMHSSNQVANIQTLHGLNPGGIGVIRGKVTYCSACKKGGSGTPASRIKMILTDAAGRVQAYTYTDKSGNFTFSKLALKNYSVWVDEPLVDNTKAPIIAVTSSKPVRDSLQFTLYPEFLDLNVTSSIANDKMGAFDMDIYPNPSSSDFTLHYKMEHEARVVVNVTDITGNSVFVESKIIQAGDHTSQIRSLAPGMYFIVLNVDGKIFSRKIISNSGN